MSHIYTTNSRIAKFIDDMENYGYLYKWWLDFPGAVVHTDYIERRIPYVITVSSNADNENNIREQLANIPKTCTWSFKFEPGGGILFFFDDAEVAFSFSLFF